MIAKCNLQSIQLKFRDFERDALVEIINILRDWIKKENTVSARYDARWGINIDKRKKLVIINNGS